MSNDRNSKQGFSHLDLDIENCLLFGICYLVLNRHPAY